MNQGQSIGYNFGMNSHLVSFVIPAKNEEESLLKLYQEILDNIKDTHLDYEIIFVDDGSTDNTFEVMSKLHSKDKKVKVIKFRGNFGKSAALQVAFDNVKGNIVFTLDADLQDNPKEIPNFLRKLDEGFDLVSGWKRDRHDPWHKVIPSRILNWLTGILTGVKLHDINCGFKAYKVEVLHNINLYGEQYRFIPILASKQNFKVGEIIIEHRPRLHGKSKFGIERNIKGFLDLLTITFLTGYMRRPGHFFGTLGLTSFFFGTIIGLYITFLRITTGSIQYRNPLLFLGILLMIIGVQLISTGLIAEMIIYSNRRVDYTSQIKEFLK